MQYFRKTDLANTYHVSVRAVTNWIEATKKGKLDLALYEEKGKLYVANTARNIATIEKIVVERRKYRTTKAHKVITPKPEFYETFSPDQVVDIITNLEINREIPRQYNYFNKGADRWNSYAEKLYFEESPNMINASPRLLKSNMNAIESLIDQQRVQIVEIGPGNGLPSKDLIGHFVQNGKLAKYIAIDISPKLLSITKQNIRQWFEGQVKFESRVCDISHQRFTDIFTREAFKKKTGGPQVANLALFLGGTLDNFRDQEEVLKVIRHSLGKNDFLIYTTKLDSISSRQRIYPNIGIGPTKLSPNHVAIFELLNIDESLYDVESGFDAMQRMRFIKIRLNTSISLRFERDGKVWIIDLNKNDTILPWFAWGRTSGQIMNQFEDVGFELLQASITDDGEYLLTIHRVKRASAD